MVALPTPARVATPSTVIDLSGSEPVLVREGKGDVDVLEIFD